MKTINQHIGKNLKILRENAGLSQRALGAILGVTAQQIQKYERGTNRISAETLFLLRQRLDARYEHFFIGIPPLGGKTDT
jgi:transcriptional regulator with XRE-family HTH domain